MYTHILTLREHKLERPIKNFTQLSGFIIITCHLMSLQMQQEFLLLFWLLAVDVYKQLLRGGGGG